MLQHSNLNQSHEGEYEDTEQIEDVDASTFDSDSWANNDEELKEDTDDNTSFLQCQIQIWQRQNFRSY